jgi:threonine/homoserine/homoserine lactone efflux protein
VAWRRLHRWGAFVLYLAWDSLRPVRVDPEAPAEPSRSCFKGILTNLLSPHPWLFWLTVGAAILAKAIAQSWLVAAVFLFGFYLLLVGSKVLVALLAGGSRNLLAGRLHWVVMRVLAVLLALFALLLFREKLRQLEMLCFKPAFVGPRTAVALRPLRLILRRSPASGLYPSPELSN